MDKIIKEVLTNKKVRDSVTMASLVVTVTAAGQPWWG